ncbi:MAG: hypothetical protein Q4C10_07255 [Clostridia bacterium]|nr:hypothetical protein [Clostridia bacterium]
MRDKYFNLVQDVDYACIYYQKYYSMAVTIERIVSALCACVSTVGIAGWAIWKEHPLIWSVLIAISQTVAVIFPYTPYKKRRLALDYMIPRLQAVKLRVFMTWQRHCDDIDYDFTEDFLHDFQDFHRTDTEFLGAEEIPTHKKMGEKARALVDLDLSGQFKVKEEDLIGSRLKN